ncbi:synaptotagmin-15-like [Uloborus diversus]|uniref:synaptotagmin-15-like n=1 Tax=Uloborus diversus TaxID=327109 RepID=UPI00240997FD|nr:synaptotagmin-15-like [Uloborus diversus]
MAGVESFRMPANRFTPEMMDLEALTSSTEGSPPEPTYGPIIAEARKMELIESNDDSITRSLLAGGAVGLLLLLPLLFTLYWFRRRSVAGPYEDIPEGGFARKRASRCSQASIYSCNSQRPIDFILPSIPPGLVSPASVSPSSECSDKPLWARLAMIDTGPALLGGLNPELYRISVEKRDDEQREAESFPEGHVGRLWLGLQYEPDGERLLISVIRARNLPSRVYGCNNCCDPFVRVYVLPDERRYVQTKMKKKTCNPKFEESFVFQIPAKNLEERTIKATILDSDRGRHYHTIGHAFFSLKDLNTQSSSPEIMWQDLAKDPNAVVPCCAGEMLVSLCYNAHLERLTVTICEAKGIEIPDGQETLDSYVKLTFLVENRVLKTKKTQAVKKSKSNPQYNESFHFRLPQRDLDSASLIVQVNVAGGPNKDKVLGRLVFGSYMFVRGKPLEHWNEAISAGHKQIRHWQKLTIG